jgi:hypothetical protein
MPLRLWTQIAYLANALAYFASLSMTLWVDFVTAGKAEPALTLYLDCGY